MFLSAAWRLNSSQTQISSAFLLESDFVRPHDTHLILDYVSQGVDSREASETAKSDGALLVAASIVAAIRLRGEDIRPSPKLTVVVKDSIELARTVLAQLER